MVPTTMPADSSLNPFLRRAPTQLHYGTLVANALIQNRRKSDLIDGPVDVTFQTRLALARGAGPHLQWDFDNSSRPDEFKYTGDGLFSACTEHAHQFQHWHEQHPSWYDVLQAFVTVIEQRSNSTPLVVYLPYPNLDNGLLLSTRPVYKDEQALVLLSFEDFWNEENILGENYHHIEWKLPASIEAGEYENDITLLEANLLNPAAVHVLRALTSRQLAELFFEVFLMPCERDIATERAAAVLRYNSRFYDPGDLTPGKSVETTVVHQVKKHLTPSLQSDELFILVRGLYCEARDSVLTRRSFADLSRVLPKKRRQRAPEDASRGLPIEFSGVHVENSSTVDVTSSPRATPVARKLIEKQAQSEDLVNLFKRNVTSCLLEELLRKTPNILPHVSVSIDLTEEEIQRHCHVLTNRIGSRLSDVVHKAVKNIFKARGFVERKPEDSNGQANIVKSSEAQPEATSRPVRQTLSSKETVTTEVLAEVNIGTAANIKDNSSELSHSSVRKQEPSSVEPQHVGLAISYIKEPERGEVQELRKFKVDTFVSDFTADTSNKSSTDIANCNVSHPNKSSGLPGKYLSEPVGRKDRLLNSQTKLEAGSAKTPDAIFANRTVWGHPPTASAATSNVAPRGSLSSSWDSIPQHGNRTAANFGREIPARSASVVESTFELPAWGPLHTELAYWVVRAKTSDRHLMEMAEFLLGKETVGSHDLAHFICGGSDALFTSKAAKLELIDNLDSWNQQRLTGPEYWCKRRALIHRSVPASIVFYAPIIGLTVFSLVIAIKKGERFWDGAETFLNLFFTGAVAVVLALMGLSVGNRFVVWDYIMATAALPRIPTEPEHRRAALRAICESENPSLYVEDPVGWMPHPCHGWTQIPQRVPLDEVARGACLVISGRHLIANICGSDRRMYMMDDGFLIAGEWMARKGFWYAMVRARNRVQKTVPRGSSDVAAVVATAQGGSYTTSPLPSPETTLGQEMTLQFPRPPPQNSPRPMVEASEPSIRESSVIAFAQPAATESLGVKLRWVGGDPTLRHSNQNSGAVERQTVWQRKISGKLRSVGIQRHKQT